jgi:hypothetical protein
MSRRNRADSAEPQTVFVADDVPAREEHTDDRLRLLAGRLEDGYQRIDQAALAGHDVTAWETFWIKLLREYEHVCVEIERAA